MEENELRIRIIETALDEFNGKGIHFTMDQIAKRLGISKKTIYTVFEDKESLIYAGVEHGFAMIKRSEVAILKNDSLSTVDKIRRVLIVLPDRFRDIDFRQIYGMTDTYPEVFNKIVEKINTGWEPTIQLIEQGIREGKIRKISIPVFRVMVEASIKSFISSKELIESDISYEEALEDMIDILMEGIVIV